MDQQTRHHPHRSTEVILTSCLKRLDRFRIEPTLRYVSVEGPVTRTVPASHEDSWEMASRYLPPNKVADFLEYEEAQSGQPVAIYMRPEHWVSADLGAL
jgi:hypothetical protein